MRSAAALLPVLLGLQLAGNPQPVRGSPVPVLRSVSRLVEAARVVEEEDRGDTGVGEGGGGGAEEQELDGTGVFRAVGPGEGEIQCGPFLLVEEEMGPLRGRSMRRRRPVAGICAVTIALAGDPVLPWTNHRGHHDEELAPGGVMVLLSGSGCVAGVGEPPGGRRAAPGGAAWSHVCRVWIDQGCEGGVQHPIPVPEVAASDVLFVHEVGPGHRVRVLLGEYDGTIAPFSAWKANALLLEGEMDAGAPQGVLELPRCMTSAVVYVPLMGGRGRFGKGGVEVRERQAADVGGRGGLLTVKNEGDRTLRYVLCAGEPFPPGGNHLVLSRGGGFACRTEREGMTLAQKFWDDPKGFGGYDPPTFLPKGEWDEAEEAEQPLPPNRTFVERYPPDTPQGKEGRPEWMSEVKKTYR